MAWLFTVLRTHGPDWHELKRLADQPDRPAHAAFMDAPRAEGFTLLVGSLEGAPRLCRSCAPRVPRRSRPDSHQIPGQ